MCVFACLCACMLVCLCACVVCVVCSVYLVQGDRVVAGSLDHVVTVWEPKGEEPNSYAVRHKLALHKGVVRKVVLCVCVSGV